MRYAVLTILLSLSYTAHAAEPVVKDATTLAAVHSDDSRLDVRLLGRLNVNTATREQLLLIPSLDPVKIDQLIEARGRGALTTLAAFDLPDDAVNRLSLKGPSTLRRIRPLPLEVYAPANTAAR